jgi:hypothetical protein
VFRRNGTRWAQEAKLIPGGETGTGQFGRSVALSAAGTIALVGAPADANGTGAAWAFTRTKAGWSELGGPLTGSRAAGPPGFGHSVSLSSTGTTAVVGGPVDSDGAGAAWVFALRGASWSPGPKLTAKREVGPGQFGDSLALSSNGNRLIVGGATDSAGAGAVWLFSRTGRDWAAIGNKLVAGGGAGSTTEYGDGVALARNGSLALVGGLGAGDYIGAAWLLSSA